VVVGEFSKEKEAMTQKGRHTRTSYEAKILRVLKGKTEKQSNS